MTGQICTPERAAVHAAINARITPAFASVGLLETCEQLAAYDADLRAQIAQLTAERDEARAALAGIENPAAYKAAFEGMEQALERLKYWFDTDPEILAAMTEQERADNARQLDAICTALQSAHAARGEV